VEIGKEYYMKTLLIIFITLVSTLCAGVSSAQVTYDGCVDFRGQPVASILDYSVNDVAVAGIDNIGQAVIRYNPRVLAQMSGPTRQFFYTHECAHHVLGHTIRRPSLSSEREADCWAINTMRDDMGLSVSALRAIQNDIARMSRGDWTHLPGPYRAIDIENCLGISDEDSSSDDYNERERKCNKCDGLGIRKCRKCGGRGVKKCNKCQGEGMRRCVNCNGAGRAGCVYGPCRGCGFTGVLICGNCGGAGGFACNKCFGEGVLECRACDYGDIDCSKCRGTGFLSR
jgi:hypothetical protein